MMMADTLCSYGKLARYKDVQRIEKVNDYCMVGGTGEFSDFQYLMQMLNERTMDDFNADDGITKSAREYHAYLGTLMYCRRSRFNPLWNQVVVAGYKDGESFLGFVDLLGTSYEEKMIATGYGAYLSIPLMRKAFEGKDSLTEQEARALLIKCMTVLFYRHCKTINRFHIA